MLENTGNSKIYKLYRSEKDEMYEFLANIELILSSIGLTFLTDYTEDDKLFYCKTEKVSASGKYTNEGFIVLAGSTVVDSVHKSFSKLMKDKRVNSIGMKEMELKLNKMTLLKDKIFNTPSTASICVLGRSSNGWTEWKYKNGITLDKIIRQS